jgi:NAD(P)-dependent dehydrogenase (short-subunit alcohol dehydrogenase family)
VPEFVLVTGGSGGIGSAVCRRLADRGYRPIVGYGRAGEAARAIAAETGGIALHLDMADDASIDAGIACLTGLPEPLAGIVLAASPPPEMLPMGQATREAMELQWTVNVLGSHRLLAGAIRQVLRKRKQGTILGVLSAAMGDGIGSAWRSMASYIVAKYGLAGVLATAAADYPWLRVVSVSPDRTDTPMLAAFDPRFLEGARERGEFLRPEEVARTIVDKFLDR